MPPPVTVTVPLRAVVPVLAVVFTAKLPLLLPLVGVVLSQLWSSLTVQLTFEVTVTFVDVAPAPTDSDEEPSVRLLEPPHRLSTSGASFSPLLTPAAFCAMHFDVAGGYTV